MNPFEMGLMVMLWAMFWVFWLAGYLNKDGDYNFGALIILIIAVLVTIHAGAVWQRINHPEPAITQTVR